ncbi:endonuclease/exonuclease/phosphatase family protein [Streptomyces sp. NPDC001985]|uniref:endonuclease/exonuclease/phosphatase family protein n=1 Tax=Streptomyces sp. NPDC001985 TaxID=3154406 RepID=UPI0033276254
MGTARPGGEDLRVLSYNIRSLRDDFPTLTHIIRTSTPDLLFLQEAPRFFRWRHHAARLAAATGLLVLGGGAPAAGPLLLCSPRVGVERTEDILLPLTPGLHRRGFATAVVRIGGARVGLLSCHLSLRRDERHTQAGLLLDHLAAMDVPHTIAAGDLNEPPTGPAFRRISAELQDCWAVAPRGGEHTYPSTAPTRRIDAVFAGRGLRVLGCGVPDDLPGITPADFGAATDHLPVLATLSLPVPPVLP